MSNNSGGVSGPHRIPAPRQVSSIEDPLGCLRVQRKIARLAHLAPLLRRVQPEMIERLNHRLLDGDLASGLDDRARRVACLALTRGVTDFIDLAGERCAHHAPMHQLFEEVGRAAISPIAANEGVWSAMAESLEQLNLRASEVAALAQGVATYLGHVSEAIQVGGARLGAPAPSPRVELVQALLSRRPCDPAELSRLSEAARWEATESLTVLGVEHAAGGDKGWPVHRALLSARFGPNDILIAAARDTQMAIQFLRRHNPDCPVAVCQSISRDAAAAAAGWATSLLNLFRVGRVSSATKVIQLSDHAHEVVLQSDLALGQWVAEQRLAPLLGFGRTERLALAETLLQRLSLTESTARLAGVLSVHTRTVRNRGLKLRDLFGEDLNDQQSRLELIVALHAVLPTWRADVEQCRRTRRH